MSQDFYFLFPISYSLFPNPCLSLFRQLGCVPAAAEGADQAYAGYELAGLEVEIGALVLEQGGFGGEDFEVAGDAAPVALVRNLKGVLRGIDCLPLDGRLSLQDAQGGELVFDVAEGR